jgi:hypothetical protein
MDGRPAFPSFGQCSSKAARGLGTAWSDLQDLHLSSFFEKESQSIVQTCIFQALTFIGTLIIVSASIKSSGLQLVWESTLAQSVNPDTRYILSFVVSSQPRSSYLIPPC